MFIIWKSSLSRAALCVCCALFPMANCGYAALAYIRLHVLHNPYLAYAAAIDLNKLRAAQLTPTTTTTTPAGYILQKATRPAGFVLCSYYVRLKMHNRKEAPDERYGRRDRNTKRRIFIGNDLLWTMDEIESNFEGTTRPGRGEMRDATTALILTVAKMHDD